MYAFVPMCICSVYMYGCALCVLIRAGEVHELSFR